MAAIDQLIAQGGGQQFDPLAAVGRVTQLQNLRLQQQSGQEELQARALQNQQAQQQYSDTQAMRQAYKGAYDPQTGAVDTNKLFATMAQNGLGHMIPQIAQQNIAMRESLLKLKDQDLKNQKSLADQYGARAGAILNAPPEQQPAMYAQELATEHKAGNDVSRWPQQWGPDAEAALTQFYHGAITASDQSKQLMDAKKFAEEQRHNQATEAAGKAELGAKTVATTGGVKQFNPATGKYENTGIGMPASVAMMSGNLSLTPQATQLAAGLYRQTGQLPGGFGRAPQVTANVINTAATQDPNADIAANKITQSAKKGTTTYFTSGAGGKQLTAFNTAITHLDTLQRLAGDLDNTDVQIANRAKQAWAEQTGNPAPANFAAAKNAMAGEVAAALKASGATDQEITHVSATFDRKQSPAQLSGAINTYRELLNSKAQQLQKQYAAGVQGKPNFGSSSAITVTDPRGVVHTFKDQASADNFKKLAGIK